jgi:putative transposase
MIKAEGDARRLANASLSAVSAVGGDVSSNLGRKSKFRHSPMITEA